MARTKEVVEEVAVEETVEEVVETPVEETVVEEVVETKTAKKAEKVYLVETPVKNFSGIVAGVHFAYGKAEVQAGWILDWFKEKGYKVTEVK